MKHVLFRKELFLALLFFHFCAKLVLILVKLQETVTGFIPFLAKQNKTYPAMTPPPLPPPPTSSQSIQVLAKIHLEILRASSVRNRKKRVLERKSKREVRSNDHRVSLSYVYICKWRIFPETLT